MEGAAIAALFLAGAMLVSRLGREGCGRDQDADRTATAYAPRVQVGVQEN